MVCRVFFFESEKRTARAIFHSLFSLSSPFSFGSAPPTPMPPPAPIGAASCVSNADSRSVPSLPIAIPKTAPRRVVVFPTKKKKQKKDTRLATQSTHAAHFPFLLARSLSKPKSRSSRACRPDDPKQETLRDGLNNVSDLEKERGENWKKAKGFRFGCQRLDHFFFL